MAKLVQKSGYIKSGKASGYMRYIATREGVEKLAGNGSVTKGQRELIQKLLTDFPDAVELFEYEDYCKTPTLGTASAFISMALDANFHEMDSESADHIALHAGDLHQSRHRVAHQPHQVFQRHGHRVADLCAAAAP